MPIKTYRRKTPHPYPPQKKGGYKRYYGGDMDKRKTNKHRGGKKSQRRITHKYR